MSFQSLDSSGFGATVVDNWSPPINNFHFLCLSPQICARPPFNRFNGLTRFDGFLVSVLAKTSIVPPLVSLVSKRGQSGNSIAVAKNHQALPASRTDYDDIFSRIC